MHIIVLLVAQTTVSIGRNLGKEDEFSDNTLHSNIHAHDNLDELEEKIGDSSHGDKRIEFTNANNEHDHEIKYGHQDDNQDEYKTYQPEKIADHEEHDDGDSSKKWYDNWISSDRHHGQEDVNGNDMDNDADESTVFDPDLVYSMSKKSRDEHENSRKSEEHRKFEKHAVEKPEMKSGHSHDKCTDYKDVVSDAFKILDDKNKTSRSLYGRLRKKVDDLTMFGYCFDSMLVMDEYGMSREGKFFNPLGLFKFKWLHADVYKEKDVEADYVKAKEPFQPYQPTSGKPYQPYQPPVEPYQLNQPSGDYYEPEEDPYGSHEIDYKPHSDHHSSGELYKKPIRDYEPTSHERYQPSPVKPYEQSHESDPEDPHQDYKPRPDYKLSHYPYEREIPLRDYKPSHEYYEQTHAHYETEKPSQQYEQLHDPYGQTHDQNYYDSSHNYYERLYDSHEPSHEHKEISHSSYASSKDSYEREMPRRHEQSHDSYEPEKQRQHYKPSHESYEPSNMHNEQSHGSYASLKASYEREIARRHEQLHDSHEHRDQDHDEDPDPEHTSLKRHEELHDSTEHRDQDHDEDPEHTSLKRHDSYGEEDDWVGDGWCRPKGFCSKCTAGGKCCRRFCLRVLYEYEHERQSCDQKYCDRRKSSDLCRKCRQCECTSGKYVGNEEAIPW